MSAFFPSTAVSPDVSGDDEDEDEGGGCPVNQTASMVMYTFFSTRISLFQDSSTLRRRNLKTAQFSL